jgi:hypothetical protein
MTRNGYVRQSLSTLRKKKKKKRKQVQRVTTPKVLENPLNTTSKAIFTAFLHQNGIKNSPKKS